MESASTIPSVLSSSESNRAPVYPNYAPLAVVFERGEGEFLYDHQGKQYIDLLAGIAVCGLGHAHPRLVGALTEQAQKLWHVSNLYEAPWQRELAQKLLELTHARKSQLARVFFCNSGTEANEAALKLARVYGQKIHPDKFKILTLKGSFHGRTMGSACLTAQNKGQELMGPLAPGFVSIEPNDLEALQEIFTDEFCAVFVEPILGEGGVLPLDKVFLEAIQELCRKHRALFVCDEVQSGMFRTGAFWAHQNFNLCPDVVTSAKGLGGGFPIGALLTSEALSGVLVPGMHGSTFGGNLLATRVALEVLRVFEEQDVGERVRRLAGFVEENLKSLVELFPKKVARVRGQGFLWGVVLHDGFEAPVLVKKSLEKGLVWGSAGKQVLRFAPSLLIQEESLRRAFERTREVFDEI